MKTAGSLQLHKLLGPEFKIVRRVWLHTIVFVSCRLYNSLVVSESYESCRLLTAMQIIRTRVQTCQTSCFKGMSVKADLSPTGRFLFELRQSSGFLSHMEATGSLQPPNY